MSDTDKIETIKQWLGTGAINLFGRPFSGKDTQGERLADYFGTTLIGSGEIFRSELASKSTQELIQTGKLAPSTDFAKIVLPFFSKTEFNGRPLVLSSVGRWHGEEEMVIEALDKSGHPLKAAIYLEISDEQSNIRWEALQQLKDRVKRADDAEGVLGVRLDEFKNKTIPVIDYYRQIGMLIEIDGTNSREQVAQDIIDSLYEVATKPLQPSGSF